MRCGCADSPGRGGTKLCGEAANLARERMLAGDKNNGIRTALLQAGHYSQLSDRALYNIRHSPEVVLAHQEARQVAQTIGFGNMVKRLELLDELAEELLKRAGYYDYTEEERREKDLPIFTCSWDELMAMTKLVQSLFRQIGRLVDDKAGAKSAMQAKERAKGQQPAPVDADKQRCEDATRLHNMLLRVQAELKVKLAQEQAEGKAAGIANTPE